MQSWFTKTKTGNWVWRLAAAALSGTLWFLACASFDIWILAWFAMVPTLWAIRDLSPKRAFLVSWLAGTVANIGGFYWIVGLLERFGNIPFVGAFPIFLLMMAYQGLEFGLWGWWLALVRKRGLTGVTWVGPVLMAAVEMLLPFIFPWYLAITQAWVVPVIQVADLTGPIGVSFLLMVSNSALFDLLDAWAQKKTLPLRRVGLAALLLVAALVYGQIRLYQVRSAMKKAPKVTTGLIQGNIGITLKGERGFRRRQLRIHQELSRFAQSKGADLLVWSESSYPYVLPRNITKDDDIRPDARVRRGFEKPVIFGSITAQWKPGKQEAEKVYNTAIMMDGNGRVEGLYDKIFLLVFGEYIPFYNELSFMKSIFRRHRMSNFDRGKEAKVFKYVRPDGTYNIGPLICYEDIIPAFGRRLAKMNPNILVNITNDAWFGATSEPYEHMALAVYRSVELRLAMARSVNTGVSALILPTGKVERKAPAVGAMADPNADPHPAESIRAKGYKNLGGGLWQALSWPRSYVLIGKLPLMDPPKTVYAAVGDLFGWLNVLLTAYLLFFYRRKTLKKLFTRQGASGINANRAGAKAKTSQKKTFSGKNDPRKKGRNKKGQS